MAERQIPQRAIYAIVCADGRFYVGGSKDIKNRWKGHLAALREGSHKNAKMQEAFVGMGEESFMLFILEVVGEDANLLEREQFWLDLLRATERGFNRCPIAGSTAGMSLTETFKAALRARTQGSGAPWAKLTEADVLQMRARHAAGESLKSLARSYGVTHSTANRTVHRKNWKHI